MSNCTQLHAIALYLHENRHLLLRAIATGVPGQLYAITDIGFHGSKVLHAQDHMPKPANVGIDQGVVLYMYIYKVHLQSAPVSPRYRFGELRFAKSFWLVGRTTSAIQPGR